MGYHRAGFEVVGVDNRPQPNYPFEFHQADALEFPLEGFDAIHASPPCQAYSVANNIWGRTDHPDLIAVMRDRLIAAGVPYVIENVEGARRHMRSPVTVCGLAVGCNVRRHRLFECSFPVMVPFCGDHRADYVIVFGGGSKGRGKTIGKTAKGGSRIRRPFVPIERARAAMGCEWMARKEMSEAIPPAYTELVGTQLLIALDYATRSRVAA